MSQFNVLQATLRVRAFTIKLKLCTRPYLMFPYAFRKSESKKVIVVTNDVGRTSCNNVKMKKKMTKSYISTILRLKCVFSDTLIFLFGGYKRSFIIMKVPQQFLFHGRGGKTSTLLSFSNFNRWGGGGGLQCNFWIHQ